MPLRTIVGRARSGARPAASAALALAVLLGSLLGCSGGRAARRAPQPALPPACCALLERAIIKELNRARTNPRQYAVVVQATIPDYRGTLLRSGDSIWVRTQEGAAAAREAARALRAARPMAALSHSVGMSLGAADHVRDQGRRGGMEHRGSDGSMAPDRVNRYGRWHGRISENMSFGPATARDVVVALLVDDGIPDRGHRRNILDPAVRIAGVSCGPHKTYRIMCAIVHAASYTERPVTASRD